MLWDLHIRRDIAPATAPMSQRFFCPFAHPHVLPTACAVDCFLVPRRGFFRREFRLFLASKVVPAFEANGNACDRSKSSRDKRKRPRPRFES